MDEVKICFIGAGGIAQSHLKRLKQISYVRIVGVYDNNSDTAKKFAELTEGTAQIYDSPELMLKKTNPTAVYICIPPFAHSDHVNMVVGSGINLFVEKPVELNLKKAIANKEIIEKAKIITATGYQTRYLDIVNTMKNVLTKITDGLVFGYWLGGVPSAPWWKQKHLSGGQIVEQSTHIYDLLRYLFGEVEEVSGYAIKGLNKNIENYSIDDGTTVNLKFNSGVIGSMYSGCFLTCGRQVGLEFFSRDMVIKYKHPSLLKLIKPDTTEDIKANIDFALEEDKMFIEAVKTKNQNLVKSSYADAVETLKLTISAQKAVDTGKVVRIS